MKSKGNKVATLVTLKPKLTILNESTVITKDIQNVKVARFARNAECDFLCDFQTL